MRKLLQFLFIWLPMVFSGFAVSAQQISLYDHYYFNPTIYNPAFAGNKETSNIMILSRNQWLGFKDSPKLNALTIDGNIFNEKMGLGAMIYSDTKGINKTIGGNLMYSYRINLSEKSHLNFGVTFLFVSKKINFTDATVQDVSDPTLLNSQESKTNFNGDFGIAYFNGKFELGLTMNQFLSNKSTYFTEFGNDISYTPSYHFINSIKYTFTLNKEKGILIAPQSIVRYTKNAPLQYEVNTNLYYKKMFWIGAAYKHDYAVSVNAGINILQKFDIGYSYNIITSDIGQYAGVTHEVMLNVKFGKKEKKEKKKKEEEREPEVVEEKDTAKVKKEVKEAEVIILEAPAKEFEDENGNTPSIGVYVIVGSFKENEYAKKYATKIKGKGYSNTNKFYSGKRGYNYVYMFKENNIKEAMQKIDQARKDGSKDAWIIILTE